MEDIVGNCLVATDVDQFPLHLPADRAKNFVGQNFWARGYYVSTVWRMKLGFESTSGRKKKKIRNSIN
jgi:hypothetical protein